MDALARDITTLEEKLPIEDVEEAQEALDVKRALSAKTEKDIAILEALHKKVKRHGHLRGRCGEVQGGRAQFEGDVVNLGALLTHLLS